MSRDPGYYGATAGELHVVTGYSGYVGVQLEQGAQALNLAQMYRSGLTVTRISARTGLAPGTVWRILKREGVKIRARGHRGNGFCIYPECGKACGKSRRCPIHRKIRNAELNREAVAAYQAKAKRRTK